MKYDAIVVANGISSRSELGFNKVFFVMKNNKTVLENACSSFIEDEECQKIIIVTDEIEKVFQNDKVVVVNGGDKRYISVQNGLNISTSEFVFIHDGARPFLEKQDISKLKEALIDSTGAILVSKSINTLKQVKDGNIINTLDRNIVYNALTPQAFKTSLIKKAYSMVDLDGITDDSSVFEKAGYKVKAIEGLSSNIKLTRKEDFANI